MGMFDYITCEMPIDAPEGIEFQTKDTDAQYLEKYKIDKDGYLWHESREYKWQPDPEREWVRLSEFRGEINFYTDIEKEWHEYSAIFDNGKVISIERIRQ